MIRFVLLGLAVGDLICPEKCNCSKNGDEVVVNCRNQDLEEMPTAFISDSTTKLILAENSLEEFSTAHLDVQALKELDLSMNALAVFLDPSRKKWANLETLNLSDNYLRWIPITLFQRMKALQHLNLSNNRLLNINQVKFPSFLRVLNVAGNQIAGINERKFLSSAVNLQTLDMSDNNIQDITPRSLSHLRNLEILNLAENELTEIPNGAFYGLVSCHNINLSFNNISDIATTAFVNFGHKSRNDKIINLTNNKFSVILADWIKELENESKFCHVNDECSDNISLLLENNPLYCDCNMQQVRDQHEMIFGDLEITQCVNQDITVYEFHDELCCDINNID